MILSKRAAKRGTVAVVFAAALALTLGGITGMGGGVSHDPKPVDDIGVHLAAQSTSVSQSDGVAQPDIVGGQQATGNKPWIISLEYDIPLSDPTYPGQHDFHVCTASQFGQYWAVLNAHCITYDDGTPYDAATIAAFDMHVRVGSLDRLHGGIIDKVTQVIPVPGWNWGALDPANRIDDFALVKLADPLPNQSLPLSPTTAKPNQAVQMLGWGLTDPSGVGTAAQMLQRLDTHVEPNAHPCDTALTGDFPVSIGEICVVNPHGTDGMCYGDSGGPLVSEENGLWTDFGGASRMGGPGCGGNPGVYTDSAYFRAWAFAVARGIDPVTALSYLPKPSATVHHGPGPQAQQQISYAAAQRWQSLSHVIRKDSRGQYELAG